MLKDVYQVVVNIEEIIRFRDTVLPDLQPEEVFYITLLARKKYAVDKKALGVGSFDKPLVRTTCTKDTLLPKLRRLEVPVGSYFGENCVHHVPQETLACYITINPRNLRKAAFRLIKDLLENIEVGGVPGVAITPMINPNTVALSNIQKSKGKKKYVIFDCDSKDATATAHILATLREHCVGAYSVIETRGGFHVLVDPQKLNEGKEHLWYRTLKQYQDPESHTTDPITPIPGTYQGGFMPVVRTDF